MKKFSAYLSFLLLICVWSPARSEEEYGNARHRATFRVESAQLCPGQEVELGIYVDLKLGQPGGGSGTYGPDQLPPDPLDNFMFYIYVSDTSLAEVVCSSVLDHGNGYKVGYPVLSNLLPELSGGNLTCAYVVGGREMGDKPTKGRFTCIWTRSRSTTKLIPDIHAPLFKIRVRSKAAGTVTIGIENPNEIAFSTGLAQMGGYYYSFRNLGGNTIPNRISGTLTPAPGPDKALVSAGKDSIICVDSRITFNAEGGKSYRWSQVYNPGIEGGYQNEYLSNRNTKNPTFIPQRAGVYMYQVEAFNELGCSTRDTVIYSVVQNTLRTTIDPNGLMIDSGSRVHFNLSGSTSYSSFKMKVTLTPDSLFAPGGNVLYGTGPSVSGGITTKPVYDPALVTATFSDGACEEQMPSIIRIKGVQVSGKIAPFPVYRCGNDRRIKSLQLNLLTRGGSDQFLYNWRATDLEFTDFPLAAPKIDKPTARTPKLTYYGRCAVSVDIYDMVSGKTVTISDTMVYRDWLQASTTVSVDTAAFRMEGLSLDGPYCEGTELTYKANSVYAGTDARYVWQVNGIWKSEGINQDTYTASLRKGDSVSCVLYSTEACVANAAVESEPFALDIRYPVTPYIELVNDDPYEAYCEDVALKAVCHSVGKNFRIQWLRNGIIEKEEAVNVENPDFCEVSAIFPRQSFYDGFTCRLVESDMPCGNFDTIYASEDLSSYEPTYDESESKTHSIYPFFTQSLRTEKEPVAAGIRMEEEVSCQTDPFTLTARVENLPENFNLAWYRKSGETEVLLGFYGNDELNNLSAGYSLHSDYGYPSWNTYEYNYRNRLPFVEDGFKIILNDPKSSEPRTSFTPGDSVFFVLTADFNPSCDPYPNGGNTLTLRSPYYTPRLLEPSTPGEFTIDYVEKARLCPSDEHIYHLVASLPGEEYYKLDWTFEYFSVTDTSQENGNPARYFNLLGARGDTLQSRITIRPTTQHGFRFGTWGDCTATVTKGCNAGKQYTATFDLDEYVWDGPFFRIRHSSDTIVCADQPVEHSMQIEEVKLDNSVQDTHEKEYTVTWYTSLQDMIAGTDGTTGTSFMHTPVPNSNQPLGTGDYDDNRGIFGYYIHAVENISGCEVFDSVFVMVAHPYQVEASIDFLYPGPWCDSSDYTTLDYSHKIEGFPAEPGGQYALLNITNGGTKPFIEWGLNDEVFKNMPYDTLDMAGAPSGDTLKAWVTTSMYTCLAEKAAAVPVVIRSSTRGDLYSHAPEKAQNGEEILLQSYVGNHLKPAIGLGGYTYTYSLEQPDGTWQNLGDGSSQGKIDWIDSLLATMPGHSARFRVESRDQYNVCPVQYDYMEVSLAVNTDITLKAFDPATGREITALCPQSYAFVYADGQPGPANSAASTVWINTTREPIDVFLRAYPQNPGQNAYVGYYKNGNLRAVGPVGSSGTLDFDPNEEGEACQILEKGDTITAHILPGDWFGAFYVHDTMSIDNQFISYSNQISLYADTAERMSIEASATAVCPDQTVTLKAGFSNNSITWLPQDAYSSQNGTTASVVVTQSAVYTAVGFSSKGCALRDSVLINTVYGDERLPLHIKSDSLRFCGTEAMLRLEMNQELSHAEDFTRFDWYVVETSGNRLIESTTEPTLLCRVNNGMRIMAQAQSVLSCQEGLSQSDTLVFEGFEYPTLTRLQPLLGDTSVCSLSEVTIAYRAEPQGTVTEWYAFVDNYRELLDEVEDNTFSYVADEDVRFEITARNADMLSCAVMDSVKVFVKQVESSRLQVSVEVNKDAVCGAEEVTYTAESNGDKLFWVANGELLNNTDQKLTRVPRLTGIYGNADSVYAVVINRADECAPADTAFSKPVLVWRVEKPSLRLLSSDTTVFESNPVVLQAEATAFDGTPLLTWHNAEGEPLAIDSNRIDYTLKNATEGDYLYYVLAFQAEVIETLTHCYSYDSVRVRVEKELAIEENDAATVLVSPNPTSGKFSVRTSVPCRVEIFSMTGARVWLAEKMQGIKEIELKVSGIYLIKATTPDGGTVLRKLVVR